MTYFQHLAFRGLDAYFKRWFDLRAHTPGWIIFLGLLLCPIVLVALLGLIAWIVPAGIIQTGMSYLVLVMALLGFLPWTMGIFFLFETLNIEMTQKTMSFLFKRSQPLIQQGPQPLNAIWQQPQFPGWGERKLLQWRNDAHRKAIAEQQELEQATVKPRLPSQSRSRL